MGVWWRNSLRFLVGVAWLLSLLWGGDALAQSSPADSTQTSGAPQGLGAVGAYADSIAANAAMADTTAGGYTPPDSLVMGTAVPDSASSSGAAIDSLLAEDGFDWFGLDKSQRPTVKFGFNANKARYGWIADGKINSSILDGFSWDTSFKADHFFEPTVSQTKTSRAFDSTMRRRYSWTEMDLLFKYAESDVEKPGVTPSRTEDSRVRLGVKGHGRFGSLNQGWGGSGEISSRSGSSGGRGGSTDQKLSTTSGYGRIARPFLNGNIAFKGGVNVAGGPQQLSAEADGSDFQETTRTTFADTLGVNLSYDLGEGTGMTAAASRVESIDRRLDYEKDRRGFPIREPGSTSKIVGNERETRKAHTINMDGRWRPLHPLRLAARYRFEERETEYTLSQQGLVPDEAVSFGMDGDWRYADAGSLSVKLDLGTRWSDQSAASSDTLRGRHTSVSNAVSLTLNQRLMAASDLRVLFRQDLNQQIYDYPDSIGAGANIDKLINRIEARLTNKSFDSIDINLSALVNSLEYIYIDADDVANQNRTETTYQVAGDYLWHLTDSIAFGQRFFLNIDYVDYVYIVENKPDTFYKKTGMTTDLLVSLIGGSNLDLSLVVDRTRGGQRVLDDEGNALGFSDDESRRQDEARLNAEMTVPFRGFSLVARTNRAWLTRRGGETELLGDMQLSLRSQKTWMGGHLRLGLNAGYVWAYGPPRVIRTERDSGYFTSTTTLTWSF